MNRTRKQETRTHPYWLAAAWSGIAGGVVFYIADMGLNALFGELSIWSPVEMIAAIVLRPELSKVVDEFPGVIVLLIAVAIHLVLSVVYGIVLSMVVFRMTLPVGLLSGVVFGLALYLVNVHGLGFLFPWTAEIRNWITLVSHVGFGLTAAAAYFEIAAWEERHLL